MRSEQLCQNCNKTIHSHFGGNHHCDNGFGGPDPNRHFTPSPSPAAQSGYTWEYDDLEGKQRSMLEYWFEVLAPLVRNDKGQKSQTVMAFCHDEGTAIQIVNALNSAAQSEERLAFRFAHWIVWNAWIEFTGDSEGGEYYSKRVGAGPLRREKKTIQELYEMFLSTDKIDKV